MSRMEKLTKKEQDALTFAMGDVDLFVRERLLLVVSTIKTNAHMAGYAEAKTE